MNVAEIYSRKLSNTIIIEIHMVGNINQDVTIHSSEKLQAVKNDAITHWRGNSYDPEQDDTQIWDAAGNLIWSYHSEWEQHEEPDGGWEDEIPSDPEPSHDFFSIRNPRYGLPDPDPYGTMGAPTAVGIDYVDLDLLTVRGAPQQDTSGDDRDPFE